MDSGKRVERRQFKRVPLQNVIVEIAPSSEGRKQTGLIRNISFSGMLISFESRPPQPEEYIYVTFILPTGGVLSYIKGIFRRETTDEEGLYSIGIEFVYLTDEDRIKLDRFFNNYDGYYQ